ncbi:polyferredoxin [Peptoniphilus olsenii]|uniref:Polyferredoxin n=1 Tax=Peptoniphilus olsenii TaxID=411570 RepID=A0ABV2JD60_9FIRM
MHRLISFIVQCIILYLGFLAYKKLKTKNTPLSNLVLKTLKIIFYILIIIVYGLMIWALIEYAKEGNKEAVVSIFIPFALLTIFGGINLYLKITNKDF